MLIRKVIFVNRSYKTMRTIEGIYRLRKRARPAAEATQKIQRTFSFTSDCRTTGLFEDALYLLRVKKHRLQSTVSKRTNNDYDVLHIALNISIFVSVDAVRCR